MLDALDRLAVLPRMTGASVSESINVGENDLADDLADDALRHGHALFRAHGHVLLQEEQNAVVREWHAIRAKQHCKSLPATAVGLAPSP